LTQSGTVGDRLREWGVQRYGSVSAFAEALGIVSEGLSPYLNNKRPVGGIIQGKLRKLGAPVEWIMTGRKSEAKTESLFDIGMAPLVGKIVATPEGKQYFEDFPAGLSVPYAKGNYFALLVENDSLINAPDGPHSMEVYPGDICIFEASRQPRDGDIVAVELSQSRGRMVKILKHKNRDEIELASANKFRNYPSVMVRKDEVASWGVLVSKYKPTVGELKRLGVKE
jgi:SOS-response transcriptional repressor LexA